MVQLAMEKKRIFYIETEWKDSNPTGNVATANSSNMHRIIATWHAMWTRSSFYGAIPNNHGCQLQRGTFCELCPML